MAKDTNTRRLDGELRGETAAQFDAEYGQYGKVSPTVSTAVNSFLGFPSSNRAEAIHYHQSILNHPAGLTPDPELCAKILMGKIDAVTALGQTVRKSKKNPK